MIFVYVETWSEPLRFALLHTKVPTKTDLWPTLGPTQLLLHRAAGYG
jgi:hypothetical protein